MNHLNGSVHQDLGAIGDGEIAVALEDRRVSISHPSLRRRGYGDRQAAPLLIARRDRHDTTDGVSPVFDGLRSAGRRGDGGTARRVARPVHATLGLAGGASAGPNEAGRLPAPMASASAMPPCWTRPAECGNVMLASSVGRCLQGQLKMMSLKPPARKAWDRRATLKGDTHHGLA